MPADEKAQNNNTAASAANKKKRNRKKKKKANAAKQQQDDSDQKKQQNQQPAAAAQSNGLNAHNLMRDKLMAEGFEGDQIDKAMNDMWDLDMAYDQYDAVLAFLKASGKPAATEAKAADATEDDEAATPAAADAAPEENEVEETAEPTAAAPAPAAAPISMAARLDLVAGFENLADAAFALTQWVEKAAKTHELDEFCAGTKTKALSTVFARAITDDHDSEKFESFIVPAMSRLVFSILQKAGLTPEGLASTKVSMESCLRFARKLFTTTTTSDDFGPRLAKFLVSRIAVAVDEAKLALAGGSGNIQRLQDDIEKIVKSLAASSNGSSTAPSVAALTSTRDMNQSAAKKASMVARMAFSTLSSAAAAENGFSTAAADTHREVELTKPDILVALVGSDGKKQIEQARSEYNALKDKVQATDTDDIKQKREELDEFTKERQAIASRITELKLSIEKLEIYDAELTAKVFDLQSEIDTATASHNVEMESLSSTMEEKQKAAKFGNSLTSLVDMLKSYDDTLDGAVQAATSPSKPVLDTANEALPTIVSNRMAMFVHHARDYLVAESEFVAGLKTRIETTETEIGQMKLEIAALEGLGMTTTIGQMEQRIEKLEHRISDDKEAIERSTSDASTMFDTLIARVEAYNLARAAEELSPIAPSYFQGIPACITALEIPNGERLNSIVEDGMLSLSPPPKQQKPPMYGGSAMADVPPVLMTQQMTAQATSAPKFTWAASKPAEASGKTSFLDIQKEELKSKADP